jgi:hypothetical protein
MCSSSFQPQVGILAAVCLFLLSGATVPAQEKVDQRAIRITPLQLFSGEAARLAPHLDLAGYGCVKFEFDGKKSFGYQWEVWENGTKKPGSGGKLSPLTSGELSFSLREAFDSDGKKKYKAIMSQVGVTSTNLVPMPPQKDNCSSSHGQIMKELTFKDEQPIAIWGLVRPKAGEGVSLFDLDKAAKEAEWALLLRVTFGKSEFSD